MFKRMKKNLQLAIITVVAVAAATLLFAFRGGNGVEEKKTTILSGERIEVLYFHLTRRCVTCQAVENVAREAVHEIYADEIKNGKIVFRSLNIEDESSEADAQRVGAAGQCLLIVIGDTRIDLTSEGFMYARTKPEKLRDEIKKAIDPLLKVSEQD